MDDNKRSATDVLLSVEERIKRVEGILQNDDMLLKQFWNILVPKLEEIKTSLDAALTREPAAPKVATRSRLSVEAVDEPASFSKSAKPSPAKKTAKKAVDNPGLGDCEITQLVQYPDGKRVLYASVKIFNSNGDCINSTKTNTAGRWTARLIPGNYKIQVSKPNPPINLEYNIVVKPSDTSTELSPVGI